MDFFGYIVTHFNYEQVPEKHGYPGMRTFELHRFFLQEVQELRNTFEKEGATLHFTVSFNKKIVDWFINHIGKADRDFAAYIKSKKTTT